MLANSIVVCMSNIILDKTIHDAILMVWKPTQISWNKIDFMRKHNKIKLKICKVSDAEHIIIILLVLI